MGVFGAVSHRLAFWAANILPAQKVHENWPAGTVTAQVQPGTVGRDLALLALNLHEHGLAFACLANVSAGAVGGYQALLALNLHELGPAGTVKAHVELGTVRGGLALGSDLPVVMVMVVGLVGRGSGCGHHLLCGRLVVVRVVVVPGHWFAGGRGPAGSGGRPAGGTPVVGVWSEDWHPALAASVDAHEVLVAAVGSVDGSAAVLKVGNALLLLLHEPWHADAFVLSGKVGAGELLVAAVRRFLATTVHHAVLLVTIQEWQPGCANSLLVGTPDAVELLVAALDGVAAAFEMGALFVFNG